jgi:hypothetical protein
MEEQQSQPRPVLGSAGHPRSAASQGDSNLRSARSATTDPNVPSTTAPPKGHPALLRLGWYRPRPPCQDLIPLKVVGTVRLGVTTLPQNAMGSWRSARRGRVRFQESPQARWVRRRVEAWRVARLSLARRVSMAQSRASPASASPACRLRAPSLPQPYHPQFVQSSQSTSSECRRGFGSLCRSVPCQAFSLGWAGMSIGTSQVRSSLPYFGGYQASHM